jgi:hypothetical protein
MKLGIAKVQIPLMRKRYSIVPRGGRASSAIVTSISEAVKKESCNE